MHERTDDQADIPEEEGSEQGPHDTAAEGESPASSFGPVCITACFGFQPDVRWGLFLALPIWGPWSNLVCVDMYATRQVLFAAPAPSSVNRDILFEISGLPSEAQFDVYVDAEGLVNARSFVELHSGSTICLVPTGTHRPWTMQLSAMLRTHLPWDASEPCLSEPSVGRYCLAESCLC